MTVKTPALPQGWARAQLGELGRYLNGRGFKKSEWRDSGRPIIRIQDLTGTGDSPNHFQGVVDPRHEVYRGDLLVSWAATLGAYVWNGPDAVLNQHIFKVESAIDRRFHYYLLLHVLEDLYRQTHGSGMVHITKGRFDGTPISLPPLAEQHRIVAAIEEHLSRLDAAVAGLERVKALLPRYRAAVLKAAVEGRLATEGATASSESSGELPLGWQSVALGDIGELQGGIQKQPKRRPVKNKYPFLRVANVGRGSLDLQEVHEVELFGQEFERLRLERGDLLIVEGNGSPGEIGRMAIWDGSIRDCVHQNHLIRHRPGEQVRSAWIQAYWNSPTGRRRVLEVASSTSGLYTLSVRKVAGLPIPLPPLEQQDSIIAEVDRLISLIDEAESAAEIGLARATALRQSILARAFRGELVPQDPNDEPAEVLLERIRAERAGVVPVKRVVRSKKVAGKK